MLFFLEDCFYKLVAAISYMLSTTWVLGHEFVNSKNVISQNRKSQNSSTRFNI